MDESTGKYLWYNDLKWNSKAPPNKRNIQLDYGQGQKVEFSFAELGKLSTVIKTLEASISGSTK